MFRTAVDTNQYNTGNPRVYKCQAVLQQSFSAHHSLIKDFSYH